MHMKLKKCTTEIRERHYGFRDYARGTESDTGSYRRASLIVQRSNILLPCIPATNRLHALSYRQESSRNYEFFSTKFQVSFGGKKSESSHVRVLLVRRFAVIYRLRNRILTKPEDLSTPFILSIQENSSRRVNKRR